jgi:hypothetical protein
MVAIPQVGRTAALYRRRLVYATGGFDYGHEQRNADITASLGGSPLEEFPFLKVARGSATPLAVASNGNSRRTGRSKRNIFTSIWLPSADKPRPLPFLLATLRQAM